MLPSAELTTNPLHCASRAPAPALARDRSTVACGVLSACNGGVLCAVLSAADSGRYSNQGARTRLLERRFRVN
jgi:hypothetical protein